MNSIKFVCSFIAIFTSLNLLAGTFFFADGSKISDAEIVSISEGQIIIEKDSVKKTYSLKKIKAYYDSDVDVSRESLPDKYIDYKVTVLDIKVPKKGENSKGKTEYVEVNYSISKKKGDGKKIKVPYFYLHILTTGKDEYSGRQIYQYYTPKQAKPKGKGYDVAAILTRVVDFGRPEWEISRAKARTNLMGKKLKFKLKGIDKRVILAWHLEIWGNEGKIYEKNNVKCPEFGIGKSWWKRLK